MHLEKLSLFFVMLMVAAPNGAWGRQWEMVRNAAGAGHLTHMEHKADSPETGSEIIPKAELKTAPDTKLGTGPESSENDLPIVLTMTKNPDGFETNPDVPFEAVKAIEEASKNKQFSVTHMEEVEGSNYESTASKSIDNIPKSAKIDDMEESGNVEEKYYDNEGDTNEGSSGEGISDEDGNDEDSSEEDSSDEESKEVTETNQDEIPETTEVIDYTEKEEPFEDQTEVSQGTLIDLEAGKKESDQNRDSDELIKRLVEDDVHLLKSHNKRSIQDQLLESDEELGSGEVPPLGNKSAKDESDDLNPGGVPAIPEDDDVSDEATDSGDKQSDKPRRIVQF